MADLNRLRNIGIIAHIDAGKTTLTERMLYLSGAKHRVGSVDAGTTETDEDPEEQERGITIFSACVRLRWGQYGINLLDTPGHVDFTAEVERCLRVLDGAVVVFSAREGVEAQSETVWRQADRYKVPRIVFINKMDREGANYFDVLEDIGPRLGGTPVPVQIPCGAGPSHTTDAFRGVVDLIEMKMLVFSEESFGKDIQIADIPDDFREDAEAWREQMLESLYEHNAEMMELALEEKPIPEEMIRATLRKGCLVGTIQPVFCGSALHGIGVQPLMDGVGHYLPCPLDRPPVEGTDPKHPDKKLIRKPDPNEPFSALVFKILPAKTGDNYWIRCYSGSLKQNSRVLNVTKDKKENVAQLWQIHALKKERDGQIDEVHAGDICCLIGPRISVTGDTLSEAKDPILLEGITFAEAVLSMAIEPESTADKKKLADVLEMLKRQDPTFNAVENEETGQTLISGMGELHLEVIQHRLTREFNLNVKFYKPRVNYRETIKTAVEVTGECHRQIGGTQMFARVKLRAEPLDERAATPIVLDRAAGEGSLPDEIREVVVDELRARCDGGGQIAGFPLAGFRVSLLGGEVAEEGSEEVAFRIAASDAFERFLKEAGPVLLEPIMRVEISTPEEYMGDIVGDLQMRRALIAKTEQRGAITAIVAHAPLKELFGYSSAIRSLSQGRAAASMQPYDYQPAPEADLKGFQFE